jgi:hypothetical protein
MSFENDMAKVKKLDFFIEQDLQESENETFWSLREQDTAYQSCGSGAFLTPGSGIGMGNKSRSEFGIRIRDVHPGSYYES